MDRLGDSDVEDQARRLRRLAAQWRAKAGETADEHYIAIMIRTAEDLEAEAADLLGENSAAEPKRSGREF